MKRIFLFIVFLLLSGCTQKIKTGFVDLGTAKLYYEESGTGHPIVMVHGGFISNRMWDDQFEDFAKHYRVIRYDARNHGISKSDPDTFSHHDDLFRLFEELGIEKAVVMGLSMGGYIAQDFTLSYPEKVSALVLAGPGMSGYEFHGEEFEEYAEDYTEAARSGDPAKIIESFQKAWTDGPHREPSEVDSVVREKVRSMAAETFEIRNREAIEKRLSPPAIGRLSEINVPVLVVVGKVDMPGIHEIVDMIEKEVPGTRKVVIDGAAHMVNMEKPEEFNRVVLEFLSELTF